MGDTQASMGSTQASMGDTEASMGETENKNDDSVAKADFPFFDTDYENYYISYGCTEVWFMKIQSLSISSREPVMPPLAYTRALNIIK